MPAKPPAPGLKRYRVTRSYKDVWSLEVDAPNETAAMRIAMALNAQGDIRIISEECSDSSDVVELSDPDMWDDPADYGDDLPTASAADVKN